MNPDQYKVLTDQNKALQDSLNRIDKDLAYDREEIQKFTLRLGAVENQIDELRKGLRGFTERTTNRFAQAMEPILTETQDLKETIDKKKTLVLPEKKRPWWKGGIWNN